MKLLTKLENGYKNSMRPKIIHSRDKITCKFRRCIE